LKSALLLGASGLVGSFCLRRLLSDPAYETVTVWVRKALPVSDAKLVQQMVDFERLADAPAISAEDVFCCLGSTIKKAGSKDAFYKVDCTYPYEIAKACAKAEVKRFLLVSALGANAGSRVFYNRVKGEVEQKISSVGLPGVYIFRPSLLLGPRPTLRIGERIAIAVAPILAPLLIGPLRKYRPVKAESVALAMVRSADGATPPGIIESDQIQKLSA
jgi:uncharacterized protein YbjT (DUF2867 family)